MFLIFILSWSGSVGGALQGQLSLSYDASAMPDTIRPDSEVIKIPVTLSYFVSGFGVKLLVQLLKSKTVPVSLSLDNIPVNTTISVTPQVVYPVIRETKPTSPETVFVSIATSKDMPAFQTMHVAVVAKASMDKGPFGRVTYIQNTSNRIAIAFKVGYYGNQQYDYTPFHELKPGETVQIPIKISGFGNARTQSRFEVLDPPENWTISIPSEVFIGTAALGEEHTTVVNMTVRAPKVEGYMNELQSIHVRVVSMAAGHPEAGFDNSTVLQVTLRCRGGNSSDILDDNLHISLKLGIGIVVGVLLLMVVMLVIRRRFV
ncbi:MAG: hypothetical protein KKC68_02720 [Candidatus Thermoplasmatota archaeon]|nr:hypothetical protein [Candidatus Thermoplasmatota archaeon]MBU1940666.1 hypothetical protein [Candidatus Thermoplasmatota archaeon]